MSGFERGCGVNEKVMLMLKSIYLSVRLMSTVSNLPTWDG